MPSPIGHMLAGMAAGWLIRGAPPSRAGASPLGADMVRAAAPFAVLAAAPDLDLLINAHSTYTHSLGAALIVGVAALLVTRDRRWLTACAAAAAVGTHVLLDWLGSDTTAPIGIMALWPWSNDFYQSSLHVFAAVSRRYWQPEFYVGNMWTLVRELAILVPVAAVAWWIASSRRARARQAAAAHESGRHTAEGNT
jgi:inner membrane protein